MHCDVFQNCLHFELLMNLVSMNKIKVKKIHWSNENDKFIKNQKNLRHQDLWKLLFIKKQYKYTF